MTAPRTTVRHDDVSGLPHLVVEPEAARKCPPGVWCQVCGRAPTEPVCHVAGATNPALEGES
jgi:hypothetical protein